jgi:hypothetical protein
MVSNRDNQFKIGNVNSDFIKICKYKIKKIPVIYSETVLLKSKIICGILNNITSDFGVVMGKAWGKPLTQL